MAFPIGKPGNSSTLVNTVVPGFDNFNLTCYTLIMSIENLPPGGEPAPGPFSCATCYPLTSTPDKLWLCFGGVKKGALWAGGDPEPPNGPYPLLLTADCLWSVTVDGFDFKWQMRRGNTIFLCKITGGANAFSKSVAGNCQINAANTLTVAAGNKYYGGFATALPELVGTPFAIPDLMQLTNDDTFWAQWINPRPMASEIVVYAICEGLDHSNVRIKIDHS